MMVFRENERSEGSEVISEMNRLFHTNQFGMKSAVGELSVARGQSSDERNSTLFPDVVIFADVNRLEPLMGWEFKMPNVSINDPELISNAKDKASRMNTSVFVLWNFRYAAVYIKNEDNTWNSSPNRLFDSCSNVIINRADVFPNSDLWKESLREVIIYLNDELIAEHFSPSPIEFNIGNYVQTITTLLTPLTTTHYLASSNTNLKPYMRKWVKNEKVELEKVKKNISEDEIATSFSKYVIMKWINRILFSHIIKRNHTVIQNLLVRFSTDLDIIELSSGFNSAVETTDFYTILHVGDYEEQLPNSVVNNLNEFNLYLSTSDFSEVGNSFISNLLENIVDLNKRELMGLYTTPKNLARLLTKLTINNAEGNFADISTGSGTIAREIIDYITEYKGIEYSHNHTWVSDKYSYPLQIANLNITSLDSLNLKNILYQKNVLSLNEGDIIPITNPINGATEELPLPKFDYIISNLPFISSNASNEEDRQLQQNIIDNFDTLDKKSDLYQIIIMKLNDILSDSPHARIGVITSNSWMKVQKNNNSFFKTMDSIYDVEFVVTTDKGRWFKNADVVTSILILKKKSNDDDNNITKFISLKENPRLLSVDNLENMIDSLKVEEESTSYNIYEYTREEIHSIIDFGLSLDSLFDNTDWINQIKEKMIPMNTIFNSSRGVRTGGDKIFILPTTETNKIDSRYRYPLLKTIQGISSYSVSNSDISHFYFYTTDTIEYMEENNLTTTIEYINSISSHERAIIRQENTNLDREWYQADQRPQFADFITSINPEQRFFWSKINNNIAVNQRVTAFRVKDEFRDNLEIIHALLNSAPSLYMLIASGFGRALGVTDLTKDGISQISFMSPALLSEEEKELILNSWETVKNLPVDNLIYQLDSNEWKEFNKIVLRAYNLDENLLQDITNSITTIINRRISAKNLSI